MRGAGRGFWSVAVNPDPRGIPVVALTAYELGGVYLSRLGGVSKSFTQITGPAMQGKDVRALGILKEGGRTFLWAGLTVRGAEPETEGGCYRYELLAQPPAQGSERSPAAGTAGPATPLPAPGVGWSSRPPIPAECSGSTRVPRRPPGRRHRWIRVFRSAREDRTRRSRAASFGRSPRWPWT